MSQPSNLVLNLHHHKNIKPHFTDTWFDTCVWWLEFVGHSIYRVSNICWMLVNTVGQRCVLPSFCTSCRTRNVYKCRPDGVRSSRRGFTCIIYRFNSRSPTVVLIWLGYISSSVRSATHFIVRIELHCSNICLLYHLWVDVKLYSIYTFQINLTASTSLFGADVLINRKTELFIYLFIFFLFKLWCLQEQVLCSSPPRPHRLWDPISFRFSVYQGPFPWG